MPPEYSLAKLKIKRKLAIIGGGISGMGAALLLSPHYDVTLYEARNRLGGHARTIMLGSNKDIAVDTGFMVFNHENYPHLKALFQMLNTPIKASDMSFAASIDDGKFEYGLQNIGRLFADPRNTINIRFWSMLKDILKFNHTALKRADSPDLTVGELIVKLGLSQEFKNRYLCPLAGAIWSTTPEEILKFPAQTLLQFFKNHGLLSVTGGPQWFTPDGGSQVYVKKLQAYLVKLGCKIRTSEPICHVERGSNIIVHTQQTGLETFDEVIFACHSDQALSLLKAPTQNERDVIGAIRYKKNQVLLHGDTSQMPKRESCWASWNFSGKSDSASHNSFTYWMNLLQSIPQEFPLFVTLNPQTSIDDNLIYNTTTLAHPQYDLSALNAQKKIPSLQGLNNTWYCGAYTGYGFHEDGLASGYEVARLLLEKLELPHD